MFKRVFNDNYYSRLRSFFENLRLLTLDNYGKMLFELMSYIREMKIDGDYFEFGCCYGYTATWAYKAAKYNKLSNMNFYCFDSFEGLPEISAVDKEIPEFNKGDFKTSEKEFLRDLKRGGVSLSRVTTFPGWYDSTLTDETYKKLEGLKAAVVLVDCDLYSSAASVLEFVTRYLINGSIIIFDDWNCFRASPEHGERKACREWLERNPHISLSPYCSFDIYGQTMFVNIKEK